MLSSNSSPQNLNYSFLLCDLRAFQIPRQLCYCYCSVCLFSLSLLLPALSVLRFSFCGVAKFFALFLGTFAPSFVESITYICLPAKLRVCGTQKKSEKEAAGKKETCKETAQRQPKKQKKKKKSWKKAQTARQKWQIMAPQRCAIKAHLLKLNIYYSCRSRWTPPSLSTSPPLSPSSLSYKSRCALTFAHFLCKTFASASFWWLYYVAPLLPTSSSYAARFSFPRARGREREGDTSSLWECVVKFVQVWLNCVKSLGLIDIWQWFGIE